MQPDAPALPLRDIHAAPPPAWWPPAVGWWVLAAIVLVLLLWIGWRALQSHRRRRRMRALIAEYEAIGTRFGNDEDTGALLAQTGEFLRRLIVRYAGNRQWAATTGEGWAEVILLATPQPTPAQQAAARAIAHDAYRPQPAAAVDVEALRAIVVDWVRRAAGAA